MLQFQTKRFYMGLLKQFLIKFLYSQRHTHIYILIKIYCYNMINNMLFFMLHKILIMDIYEKVQLYLCRYQNGKDRMSLYTPNSVWKIINVN